MKGKVAVLLILCLLLAPISIARGAEIQDLDEDHWAYDIVQDLVEKGFLSLFDDDTFRGERELTRLEMAEVIARILEHIEQREVALTGADLRNLRELTIEFREELVELTQEKQIFADRIEELEKFRQIQEEDMAILVERIEGELAQIDGIRDEVQNLERLVDTLIDQIIVMSEEDARYPEFEEELQQLVTKTDDLEGKLFTLETNFQEMVQDVMIEQDTDLYRLIREMEDNREAIESLERQNSRLRLLMGGLAGTLLLIFLIN